MPRTIAVLVAILALTACQRELAAPAEAPRPVMQVSFDKDETGANDLVFANKGNVDAPLPSAIVVAALGCDAGDAHEGFRLERSGDDWRFVATAKNVLAAGRLKEVGWLRCDVIGGVKIDDAAHDAPLN